MQTLLGAQQRALRPVLLPWSSDCGVGGAAVAQRRRAPRTSMAAAAAAGGGAAAAAAQEGTRVIALDFDGVVCDSVGESSLSAFKAAALQWPEIFQTPEAEAAKPRLVEQMRAVRPVVETGYENVVQIRCLYEGVTVDEMLASWHELLPARMREWGLDRSRLVALFGSVRDAWIEEDLQGWLAPNRIYPGVADAVRAALSRHEVYVVTTKQAHYTTTLLRDMAGVLLDEARVFSTTLSGEPKAAVLARLAAAHPGASDLVFVEDKLGTLEKVAAAADTQEQTAGGGSGGGGSQGKQQQWRLFLVDWGYNTPEERARAAADPRIDVIGLPGFQELLR